jgi:hypothetical protein
MSDNASHNLVQLDLSTFSRSDLDKIAGLGEKIGLLYRWFRSERKTGPGLDQFMIYSGARGRTPYAAYCVARQRDGRYTLKNLRTGITVAQGRTINEVLNRLPEDFFYSD